MAHSKPSAVDDHGNAKRVIEAIVGLMEVLVLDPRVMEEGRAWGERHEMEKHIALVRMFQSDTTIEAFFAALQDQPGELAAMRAFVTTSLGLPYPWLARKLLEAFWTTYYNQLNPKGAEQMRVWLPATRAPKGRWPKLNGAEIREAAHWLYRLEVKQPRDEQHDIVEEYARKAGRVTQAHSVVQNRIAQVKALLALVMETNKDSAK